jgi:hypothetical protein
MNIEELEKDLNVLRAYSAFIVDRRATIEQWPFDRWANEVLPTIGIIIIGCKHYKFVSGEFILAIDE